MMGSKRHKDSSSGQINRVDRIGSLPDSIRAYILSFLPTKDAIATSILSSEWKFLWKQVPAIDVDVEVPHIDDENRLCSINPGERVYFNNFLNNLLRLNKESCLRFCRLAVPPYIDPLYANAWIEAIATREVKEMHLENLKGLQFPFSVFTCKKLVILTLSTYGMLKVPTFVHLPNLQIINLFNFQIYDGSSLRLLTSGCPSLRELVVDHCRFLVSESNYYFCSSTLKKLQITNNDGPFCSIVVIDIPCLEYLMISYNHVFGFEISALSCLREADVSLSVIWSLADWPSMRANYLKLLNSLATSTTLRLRHFKCQGIQDYHKLPTFDKLTCLELEVYGSCCCFVPVILERTPNLVNLIVKLDIYAPVKGCELSHVIHAPGCLLRSIKVIEIRGFNDSRDAMETGSYLLMNAKVLNEMKIYFSPWHPFNLPQEERKRKLLSIPPGSCTCRVSVYSSSGSIL